ncbi:hypothetical protein GCM10028820_00120 [Tessaracoccus terricola]
MPVLSFVAWYFGGQARTEIRNGAPFSWRGGLVVGYWLGKILSILTIVSVCASMLLGVLGFILQVSLFAYIFGIL